MAMSIRRYLKIAQEDQLSALSVCLVVRFLGLLLFRSCLRLIACALGFVSPRHSAELLSPISMILRDLPVNRGSLRGVHSYHGGGGSGIGVVCLLLSPFRFL